MEKLTISLRTQAALQGLREEALVGVVASGNLEVLAQRNESPDLCVVELLTSVRGYEEIWRAVIQDFVDRLSPGGVRFTIHDGGARPDTVMLRLMQAARLMESTS